MRPTLCSKLLKSFSEWKNDDTLAVFLIIMAFQVIAIALVKHFTSEEFAKDGKTYNKARPVNIYTENKLSEVGTLKLSLMINT